MGKKGSTEDGQALNDTKGEHWVNLPVSEMSYKQNQTEQFSPEIPWLQTEISMAPHKNIFPLCGAKNLH